MQTEKQRERLVELITEFETNDKVRCPKYAEPTCEGCDYDLGDECDKTSILADYLMSNNVVVLPCNIGDTVYYINQYFDIYLHRNFVYEAKVARMVITKDNEIALVIHIKDEHGLTEFPNVKDFGKTVFLTKEEAEAKLREMQDGT